VTPGGPGQSDQIQGGAVRCFGRSERHHRGRNEFSRESRTSGFFEDQIGEPQDFEFDKRVIK
jgi:hypothetical protein